MGGIGGEQKKCGEGIDLLLPLGGGEGGGMKMPGKRAVEAAI